MTRSPEKVPFSESARSLPEKARPEKGGQEPGRRERKSGGATV
jgi:hypothetical protein